MVDWPSWITAGATIVYVAVSAALWKSTREQSRHTQETLELTRRAFEAAHQPIIVVGLNLESATETAGDLEHFRLRCSVSNNGADAASDLEVTVLGGSNYIGKTFQFGELYPGQNRTAVRDVDIDYAAARFFMHQQETSGAIRFEIIRTYKTSTGESKRVVSVTQEIASEEMIQLWKSSSAWAQRQGR